VELFKSTNIDFLGKKWYLLAFSLIFSVAGLISIFFWHGVPLGVDFKGGTLVYVKFAEKPDLNKIRAALDAAGLKDPSLQSYGPAANNEVLIKLEQKETSEAALDQGRAAIQTALSKSFDPKSFEIRSVEIVGPQVGAQLRHQAMLATL
jgi:preprotein translocase subunit SecF